MPAWQREAYMRASRTLSLGGVAVPAAESKRILGSLGFETRIDGETIHCQIPPWRPDVDGEADLVEEVLRIHGYDAIPAVSLARENSVPSAVRNAAQKRAETVRRLLASRGLVEAVTYSFMEAKQAELFGGVADSVRLVNPISAELDAMRPSILPNLVAAVARNQARGLDDPALFELGPHYADDTPEGQALVAAGVRAGRTGPRHWAEPPRPVDAFDAKADVLAALEAAGAPVQGLQVGTDAPDWYHPGRSATLRLGPRVLARFGELHPRIARAMDADGPIAAFEIFLDDIPPARRKAGAARPLLTLSAFQPVHRDFAFIVDEEVAAGDVIRAVRAAERDLIADVAVFDVYRGQGVADGRKSLAIAVTLQPTRATMTDAEIDAVAGKIVDSVKKQTGGELRG
jgi:phenylalanyl-tRNA synthetase beta chain